MIKKFILFVLLVFSVTTGQSQEIKKYTWDDAPKFSAIPEEYQNQPAVVLFDKRWIHTRIGQYAFASFAMNHTAIKINKAEEINKYNKIKAEDNGYIRDLRDFHARIIKPNGTIRILPKDKIVEAEIDKVKSIVFEGVEAGDILEYYFILKENPNASGVEVYQREIPVLQAEFTYTLQGVSLATFPSPEFRQSIQNDKYFFSAENIPPLVEEKNALMVKNLVKLIYAISVPPLNPYEWSVFLPRVFNKPSFQYFKKNQAREFIEKLDIKSGTTEEKLLKMDEYIKENFDFVWRGEKAKKITALSEGKQKLTGGDIFDLYGYTLQQLKIPYKVVVGMSKEMGDVSLSQFIPPLSHEFMYYIPETQKFISPYEKYLSYGYPMYEVQGTNGVTFTPGAKVTSTDFGFPIAPADFTIIETENQVVLSEDLSTAQIEKTYSNNGYEGQLNRNWFKYLKENEEEKETVEYLKKRAFEGIDVKIQTYTFQNTEFKHNHTNTPLLINIKSETTQPLTEPAGNLLLVNLGTVIGKQTDLYQENTRKHDVYLSYAKTYKHKIIFTIPEGYAVESYKDLVIEKTMDGNPSKNCSFKSTAKIEGNKVIIEVFEIYKFIHYPVSAYQEYRKVINASADFNKASLVLKKIK